MNPNHLFRFQKGHSRNENLLEYPISEPAPSPKTSFASGFLLFPEPDCTVPRQAVAREVLRSPGLFALRG
jgi:hypothetical protein